MPKLSSAGEFEFRLPGPLDFAASLEIFRRSGDDLLDRWDGTWLIRTARKKDGAAAYACRVGGSVERPIVQVTLENPQDCELVMQTLAATFPASTADFETVRRADPLIGVLAPLYRGFRPVLHRDLLTALVRCISAQQVNLRWAATVRRRLAERFGHQHRIGGKIVYSLDAASLADLETRDLRALQFTTRKAEYIIAVARAIALGGLTTSALSALPDAEVIATLTSVRGLGLWTAEWVIARTLGRPRVSVGDLGVRKAVGVAYFGGKMPSPDEVREATAHWGSSAALAQELLLHAQHEKSLQGAVARVSRRKSVEHAAPKQSREPRTQLLNPVKIRPTKPIARRPKLRANLPRP